MLINTCNFCDMYDTCKDPCKSCDVFICEEGKCAKPKNRACPRGIIDCFSFDLKIFLIGAAFGAIVVYFIQLL